MLVSKDEIGELCVRGTCLSMGYYGDFEKTNKVFVQNPLNTAYHDLLYRTGDLVKYNQFSELIYVCRKDFQIKHQGHRIELGEIETAVNSFDNIQQSCAVYDDENKKIMLFCTVKNNLSEKEIYKSLQRKVPKYMLPATIKILDIMPLNLNGKIDRVELKKSLER
jgi:acyl-coenzyme A synthetase/AMP-(fatty) acid ligase